MADFANGVAVIRYLLANNAAVLAIVPAERIAAGDVPLDTTLPAISVDEISGVPYNTVSGKEIGKTLHTERIQVTGLVKSTTAAPAGGGYPGLRTLMRAIFLACPTQRGTIVGVDVDSITPDLEGPDLPDAGSGVLSSTRDFFVRYFA